MNRFWQFEAFYMDHGFFDSAIWKVAHGLPPIVDLSWIVTNQLGDHFSPVMYLLSPLYLFTNAYEPILIIENLFVALSGLILYYLAYEKTQRRLFSFSLLVAFTWFIGLQNAVIAFYHNDLFAMLTLSLALLQIYKKNWLLFSLFLLLTLGLKENFAGVGIGLGVYLFLKGFRKQGIFAGIFSAIYYVLVTHWIIPTIAHYPYPYSATIPGFPNILTDFFTPKIKAITIVVSLITFGFLPLTGWTFLPTVFQDLYSRFVLNTGSARWDLGLQYNSILSVLLFFGAIEGAVLLLKYGWYKKLVNLHAVVIIASVLVLHRFVYHGPYGLLYNSAFYRHTGEMGFLNNFVAKIPLRGLIMAPNNIASHLTHHDDVMLLREDYPTYSPGVIVLDVRPGQNPNNYWPVISEHLPGLLLNLQKDPTYSVGYHSGDQWIFVKR